MRALSLTHSTTSLISHFPRQTGNYPLKPFCPVRLKICSICEKSLSLPIEHSLPNELQELRCVFFIIKKYPNSYVQKRHTKPKLTEYLSLASEQSTKQSGTLERDKRRENFQIQKVRKTKIKQKVTFSINSQQHPRELHHSVPLDLRQRYRVVHVVDQLMR